MPFSEVTILFNQHFIIVGNTVGKSPTGILTLFIYSWNPWNSKLLDAFSTVPCLPCTANMQHMHVNCKQIFSWTINNVMICRKHATSYCKYTYAEYIGICQKKHAHDQPKKTHDQKNWQNIRTNAMPSVYNAVFGGHHLLNQDLHNTVGKSRWAF